MNETEILSNLLLGRSTDQLNSGSAVSAALTGLRASGAIDSQSVAGIEVDVEAGEEGPQLSLGRYLSPRLYLGYTIGLIDQLDHLSLNYRLGKNWLLASLSPSPLLSSPVHSGE
jgi:translocation and assembly module TamB